MEKEIQLYKLFPEQKAVISISVSTMSETNDDVAQVNLMFTDMIGKTVCGAIYFISDSENIEIHDQIAYLSKNVVESLKEKNIIATKQKLIDVAKVNSEFEIGGTAIIRFGLEYVEPELVSTGRRSNKGLKDAKS